ncbi:hypothetical protein DFH09DRAFT_947897, partial [Mycena vulgaris]
MGFSIGRFRLDRSYGVNQSSSPNTPGASTSSGGVHIGEFRAYSDPTPPTPPLGSFQYDSLPSSKYTLRWDDWSSFKTWLLAEQQTLGIELRLVNTYAGLPEYERQCRYVCSRKGTGGIKAYTKLHPNWNRKRQSKRTDCNAHILVKQYPGTPIILGNYSAAHDHSLGNANLPFTQIPTETREYIAGLLRLKVSPDYILKILHCGAYEGDEGFEHDLDDTLVATRTEFIELRDIRRIEKQIEAETVRLHPDDGLSTIRWVERLRLKDQLLGFKSKTDLVPPGSNLAPDIFTLMIQSNWQRSMFQKYGEHLLCIDATHNVT